MILKEEVAVDLATPTGLMRTYIFRPAAEGKYPAVVLFSGNLSGHWSHPPLCRLHRWSWLHCRCA